MLVKQRFYIALLISLILLNPLANANGFYYRKATIVGQFHKKIYLSLLPILLKYSLICNSNAETKLSAISFGISLKSGTPLT